MCFEKPLTSSFFQGSFQEETAVGLKMGQHPVSAQWCRAASHKLDLNRPFGPGTVAPLFSTSHQTMSVAIDLPNDQMNTRPKLTFIRVMTLVNDTFPATWAPTMRS